MLFKKNEKKRVSPLGVIIVGALATVGAMSIVTACRDTVCEKGRAIVAMFKKKGSKNCTCQEPEEC